MEKVKLLLEWVQTRSLARIGRNRSLVILILTSASIVLATVSAEKFEFYKSNPNGIKESVFYGKKLHINCTTNDPNAVTSLYHKPDIKNGNWKEITGNINKTGDVYTILEFGVDEAGWFQCRATNANKVTITWIDPSTKVIPVNEHVPKAQISTFPKSVDVGDKFNMTCSSQSVNTVKWYKVLKHNLIVPVSSNQIFTKTVADSLQEVTLMIKNATISDSGSYICVASYGNKNDTQMAIVVVLEPKAPTIVNYSGKNTSVVIRSMERSPKIHCTSEGYPLPKIIWYKKKKEIVFPGCLVSSENPCRNSKYMMLENISKSTSIEGILTIFKINHRDHGTYTCVAINKKGNTSVDIFVNVETGATIHRGNQEIVTKLGKTVNIACHVSGNPLPDVVWTRTNNLKILKHGKGTVVLKLEDVSKSDMGNYTCNASNFKSDTRVFTVRELRPSTHIPYEADDTGIKSRDLIIIIVCVCLTFIVAIFFGCLVLYRRQKMQTDKYNLGTEIADYKIDPDRSLFEQCRNLPYDLDWEFPEERLILGENIGAGAFGSVIKAEAIGMQVFKPRDKTPEAIQLRSRLRRTSVKKRKKKKRCNSITLAELTVAVKTLKDGASRNDYKDLASELKILIHLGEHENIVNILGACTRGRRLMVIIEFAPHGDLLSFLRERRDIYDSTWTKTSNNFDQEFTLVDLGMAAYQISRGMEFLSSKKCVHRDLAARNILVGQDYVIKISDFGLARDIYQDDLYVKTSSGLFPIKWMALESLFDRVYTHMSDVWSFGIVLWEIFTLGGTPYPTVPIEQLMEFLTQGQRMKQPDCCPVEMYAIMRRCWDPCPEQRPNFAEISQIIRQIFDEYVAEDTLATLGYLLLDNGMTPANNCYLESVDSNLPCACGEAIPGTTKSISPTCEETSLKEPPPISLGNNNEYTSRTVKRAKQNEQEPLINQNHTMVSQHESSV